MKSLIKLFALMATLLMNLACEPTATLPLSEEQRLADMYWVISTFDRNYAPMEYKEDRLGFDWEAMKDEYLDLAKRDQTNEEFFALLHSFVAKFEDAHTASTIAAPSLPDRSDVAYLGFSGIRLGENLKVTELLPTMKTNLHFPVKIGDEIVALDGVKLPQVVSDQFIALRNLGRESANLTFHFPSIFMRSSMSHKLPMTDTATLTIKRGTSEITVILPWIVKDLIDFTREQAAAAQTTETPSVTGNIYELITKDLEMGIEGKIYKHVTHKYMNPSDYNNMLNSFAFQDNSPAWTSKKIAEILADGTPTPTAREKLLKTRNIPSNAIVIETSKTFPAYVQKLEKKVTIDGTETTISKLVGVLHLDTFSPSGAEPLVITEVKATLKAFSDLGATDILIDMVNNGGGSLSLGAQLAQLFSETKIDLPTMQFKIGETWISQFKTLEETGASDLEREIGKRMHAMIMEDFEAGKKITRDVSVENLFPYQINPSLDSGYKGQKVYVLINEMCASMCDIFAGILQDNNLATVMGTNSMGAGGNVVAHFFAPNSRLMLQQTESLILRNDGSYIENIGVKPDVEFSVQDSASTKFDGAKQKVLEKMIEIW